jgi:alkanesulfonate monooxygenase SsuD/methylene tetrahydromethanopterin reductase-like flavin-dependent oxidoreductase (luciferase family)
MRFGIVILPEHRWSAAAPLWRRAEELGFDNAWTYDHLTWAGLPDAPWYATMPTLTAAALCTSRIRLGTFVTSPNFRHPLALTRDLLSLDDISAGRFDCGIGAGAPLDSAIVGGPALSPREAVDRLAEFVELLDRLLTTDHVDHEGRYFRTRDARTLPGCVQRPRVPFVIAATGPRSLRLAASYGDGWVTTRSAGDDGSAGLDSWFAAVGELNTRLDDLLHEQGRDPRLVARHLVLDRLARFAPGSAAAFEDMTGRAAELGFTDVVTHWPRPDGAYGGSLDTLEAVATEVMPRWRA